MVRNFSAIIFDYDGTLVDTASAFVDSINEALRRAALREATRREVSSADLRSLIAVRLSDARLSPSVEEVFSSIWDIFANKLETTYPFKNGSIQVLRELAREKVALALISKRSGRAGSLPLKELDAAGLQGLFRYIRTGVSTKAYSSMLSKALEALKANPAEAVVVSDWYHDIGDAKTLGIEAVGVLGGVSDKDEHVRAGADYVIEDLNKLLRILGLA